MTAFIRLIAFATSLIIFAIIVKFLLFSQVLSYEKAFLSIFGSIAPYLNGQMLSEPYTSNVGGIKQIITAFILILLVPALLIFAILRINAKFIPLWALIWFVLGLIFVSAGI